MIDILALALSHGLLAFAAWRLLLRPDLDSDAEGGATAAGRVDRKRTPARRAMRLGAEAPAERADDD